MKKLLLVAVAIFCCSSARCQKCIQSTFQQHSIEVIEETKKNFQTVTGCITSENVIYDSLKKIKVLGQLIPVLKKGAVADIPDWIEVVLSNNSIKRVSAEAFINVNAHSITLSRNGIKRIESYAFSNLPLLDVIDLEYNRFTFLPEKTFVDLPNLTTISLSYNYLENFDQNWFYNVPKLEDLLMENNKLQTIPNEAFSKMTNLKRLSVEDNFLEHIEKNAFFGVSNLIELYLGKNRLKKLDIDFSGFKTLKFIDVNTNFLTYLSLHALRYVKSTLESMFIHANPWQCSCLEKILEWGRDNEVGIYWECRNKSLICLMPESDPKKCSDRPDGDFDKAVRENFNRDCVKQTYGPTYK